MKNHTAPIVAIIAILICGCAATPKRDAPATAATADATPRQSDNAASQWLFRELVRDADMRYEQAPTEVERMAALSDKVIIMVARAHQRTVEQAGPSDLFSAMVVDLILDWMMKEAGLSRHDAESLVVERTKFLNERARLIASRLE